MKIKIPTHIAGQEVEGAIDRVLNKQTQPISQQQNSQNQSIPSVTAQANLNLGDYVQIPNSNILISKFEPDQYKGMNWQETHEALARDGLFMPSPAIFMPYFKQVIEANKGNTQLYDGNGNLIPQNKVNDFYKHLTEDHINEGAWSWLDAKFNGGMIEINHRIVNGNLQGQKHDLESHVNADCYVDLEFNSQGLPTKKSQSQKYEQGKNMYFYKPRDGFVARFDANSDWAVLGCTWVPDYRDGSLGVFACAEGTQKNAGGSSK